MTENEIGAIIVNTCYEIHTTIGPGLFESVYEEILNYELQQQGLSVERQAQIPILWKRIQLGDAFKADLIVNGKVIVELKSVESLAPVHFKQLITYLRLADMKLGLLVNFNSSLIKDGIKRVVNGLK